MRDEIWDDLKNWSSKKKEERRAKAPAAVEKLLSSGVPHEVKNDGEHYVLAGRVDWWPGSGAWIARGVKGKRGVGIDGALQYLRTH